MFERDPNKTGRNRCPSRERSNEHSLVRGKFIIAAKEVEALSDCVNTYPIPPTHQSILRKMGLELSQRRRRGEVTRLVL